MIMSLNEVAQINEVYRKLVDALDRAEKREKYADVKPNAVVVKERERKKHRRVRKDLSGYAQADWVDVEYGARVCPNITDSPCFATKQERQKTNPFEALRQDRGLAGVPWEEEFTPARAIPKSRERAMNNVFLELAVDANRQFARMLNIKFMSEEWKQKMHNWRVVRPGPPPQVKRRTLPVRVLRLLKAKLSGQAQAMFGFDLNVNWPTETKIHTEHDFGLSGLPRLIAALSEQDRSVNWISVIGEVGFFFGHLLQGGLTMKNLALCMAHLVKNLPVKFGMEQLKRFVAPPNAQAGEDAMMVVGTALTGLVGICSLWGFSRLPDDRETDRFISRFAQLGRCIATGEKLTDMATKLAQNLSTYLKKVFLGYTDDDVNAWKGVNDFCDEVFQLNTPTWAEDCQRETTVAKVTALMARGDELSKVIDTLRAPHSETGRFRNAMLLLYRTHQQCANVGAGDLRTRVPPLMVHIFGDSGAGKSSMLDFLNSRILVSLGHRDPRDLVNLVYYRHPGNEFYDGFKPGTEICVCDDFGAVRDTEQRPSPEPLETIRMANGVPYRPPMAHLIDKAKAVFEAKAVIWTSNRPSFKFPSLTNPEAVVNRVHLKFRQKPHPDYSIKRRVANTELTVLDAEKVAREGALDPAVYRKCMLFDRMKPMEEAEIMPAERDLTFDQMSDLVLLALKNRQADGKCVIDEKLRYFNELVGDAQVDAQVVEREVPVCVNETYLNRVQTWLGRGVTHIDVERVTREWIDGATAEEIQDVRRLAQNAGENALESRFIGAACVVCPPERAVDVSRSLAEGMAAFLNGEQPVSLLRLEHDAAIQVCEGRVMHEGTFSAIKKVLVDKLKKTGTAALWWMMTPTGSPVGEILRTFVLTLVLASGFEIIAWCCRWIVSVMCDAYKSTRRFLRGERKECVCNTEAYSSGENRTVRTNVEQAYSSGEQRVTKTNVEQAYSAGEQKVARSNVESDKIRLEQAYSAGEQRIKLVNVEAVSTVPFIGAAEACSDVNGNEVAAKLMQNAYRIETSESKEGPWRRLGTATFVSGRVLMTNRHIVHCLGLYVRLYRQVGNQEFVFPFADMVVATLPETSRFHDRDVALLECPKHVPIHKSLRSFFMTAEDFSRHSSLDKCCMVGYRSARFADYISYVETDKVKPVQTGPEFTLREVGGRQTQTRTYYLSGMETFPGDCGCIMVALDKRFSRKLFGIHMAGLDQSETGYSAVASAVTQAVLDELIEEIRPRLAHSVSLTDGDYPVDRFPTIQDDEGKLTLPGSIAESFTLSGIAHAPVHRNYKTAIRKSPVYDTLGPVKRAPARLGRFKDSEGNVVDPMWKAMQKAATPSYHVNQSDLARAVDAVKQKILSRARASDARTLTFEESVKGIEGDPHYPPINRSTSPGFGWTKVGKGKTYWLGHDEYVLNNPELHAARDAALIRLKNGQRVGSYWTDTLKDELRPLERVAAGKTRLFSAGEMVLTLLMRQYFDGFAAHMARNAVEVESCVGINVYGMDWTKVASTLKRQGPHVVAGDFSNYDGTLPAEVLWGALEIINSFYEEIGDPEDAARDNRVRELLWLEIVNSIHVNGNEVYEWNHSQPSGCPFTSILNSVVHSIVIRMAFLECARRYSPADGLMTYFEENISHVNYGDDDVTNISSECVEWFNQQTMAEAYATFGMTYTDETKSGDLVKSKTLKEIQFLKRSFLFDVAQSRYLAPLSLDTVLEMACWNKTKSNDQAILTALTLIDAVYELAQHGPNVWKTYIGGFKKASREIADKVTVVFPTFEEVREKDMHAVFGLAVSLGGTSEVANFDNLLLTSAIEYEQYKESIGVPRQSLPGAVQQNLLFPCLKFSGTAQTGVGEVFTSSGECSPALKLETVNKILTQRVSEDLVVLSLAQRTETAATETNNMIDATEPEIVVTRIPNDPRLTLPEIETIQKMLSSSVCTYSISNWEGFTVTLCDLQTIISQLLEQRAKKPSWIPSPTQISNTSRSLERAINAVRSLMISPGVDLSGPAQSGGEDSVPAPDFAGETTIVHRQEVMEFHEDGEIHQGDREVAQTIPRELQSSGEDSLKNDIVGFLKRPVKLSNLTWSVDQIKGTMLSRLAFPRDWIKIPMIAQKLEGFRYLRCTFVVEIQLNSQPFNAGALLAYFTPVSEQLLYGGSNRVHWAGKMGFPHVIYRCGQATAIQLKIPFFSNISHYDLTQGTGTAGEITLEVFSQLTGASEVDGTVWAWAENVDISMPTGVPAMIPALSGEAQSGRQEQRRPGNIETISSTAARVAGKLSALPGIGAVAKAGETVFSVASGVAAMFGWSKPTDPEFTQEVQWIQAKNMTNFNGDAKSRVLALDFKNTKNIPTDVFNTTDDEMAFKAWLQKPVFLDSFQFSGDKAQDSLLWSFPVDATACKKKATAIPGTAYRYETNLSFLSTLAKYQRGGIKYKMLAIKTPFHSGRVRVTFVPGATRETVFSSIDLNKCYSKIFDLREEADIEIDVPFSFNQPWKPTEWIQAPTSARMLDDTYTVPMGYLYVSVVNALRNPSTAASSIEFIVLTSAGDDFQLAFPGVNRIVHVVTGSEDIPPQTYSGMAQAGMYESETAEEPVNADTFGEAFTGFRQWLKRYHQVAMTNALSVFRPYSFNRETVPSLVKDIARRDTAFDKVTPLFRFMSGSMRVMFAINGVPEIKLANYSLVGPLETIAAKGTAWTVVPSYLEPTVEVDVPMYQPWVAILSGDGAPLDKFGDGSESDGMYRFLPSSQGVGVIPTSDSSVEYEIWLAIGEDFSYGFMQGVPIQVHEAD